MMLLEKNRPLRTLIVDDNEDAASALALLVELWGCDVRVAHGGEEALATAHGFQPHVLLMDIGMPGMSGYEVARRWRALELDGAMTPSEPAAAMKPGASSVRGAADPEELHSVPNGTTHSNPKKRALLIAVTGYGTKADMERALSAGFDHHLVKPTNPLQLQALLASFAARKRSERAVASAAGANRGSSWHTVGYGIGDEEKRGAGSLDRMRVVLNDH